MNFNAAKNFIKSTTRPFVVILVGTPLSGKDTFINKLELDDSVKVVSRDQLILDAYGGDDYNKAFESVNQKEVDEKFRNMMTEYADLGYSVVVNMTHMSPKRRKTNLSFFGDEYNRIAVVFPILDEKEYDRRNEKRKVEESKFIHKNIIRDMISSFRMPTIEEGFNRIIKLDERW